ncbi:hypothetical protein M9H77_36338 [Catharanthus roseus]|uniref:Uncharacterized protein n=1 Tax=Catharanthus roseus TaxID=4058 RepID=A0ACB9ZTH4_CATRO|nr:hypothetical protein M9H77_36338 [Catharanthus roseus]
MPVFIDGLEEYESYIEVADHHTYDETNIDHHHQNLSESQMMKSLGSEKQISVDPISLVDSVSSGTKTKELDNLPFPILKPPSKPKFLSYSLPNSASSSPKFATLKKKPRNPNQVPTLTVNPFFRQDSIALSNLERLRENHMRRSKSCGEGRASAPPEEFDLWLVKTKNNNNNNNNLHIKPEVQEEIKNDVETIEEGFKCGVLCLFLPGIGKAKPVKARNAEPETEFTQSKEPAEVSKRVSLEKFECGSWRSSTILDEVEDGSNNYNNNNLFYDLPLEMIRCSSVSDTHSPVTAAFVFDKDRKGVLKKSSSRKKSTPDSSRHVRFSTSSPKSHPASPSSSSCVLLKAREDFNAFLEAQTA